MNKKLIIIPARGGSKGIPQKNTKFLNGKPLIAYAIENAKRISDADVYVSTEDQHIAHVANILGARVLKRPAALAADHITIDQVAIEALLTIDPEGHYQTVITLQPTSPLLQPGTLTAAIERFDAGQMDTLLSVHEKRHLMWRDSESGYEPLYENRVNRQELPPTYEENGAFVVCRASYLRENHTRISSNLQVFPVSANEGIDIDTKNDWVLCESLLTRSNLAFVVKGSVEYGMGHVQRAITLNNKFSNQNVFFYSPADGELGAQKIRSLNHEVSIYADEDELLELLKRDNIDIVVNDILDTKMSYVEKLKSHGYYVVNFEDNGPGASAADIVFNGLYEWSGEIDNSYFGYRYTTLREDIYLYPIKQAVKPTVERLLVGFGGTDINNATLMLLRLLEKTQLNETEIILVLGVGYRFKEELDKYLCTSPIRERVTILEDIPIIAPHLYDADLVISGNGRMVYETVALGTPIFVCSQNERETSHIFPRVCKGINYLGYVQKIDPDSVLEQLELALSSESFRTKMNENLIPYAVAIRKGINRVCHLILEGYEESLSHENRKNL